jgi:hypothetical protein
MHPESRVLLGCSSPFYLQSGEKSRVDGDDSDDDLGGGVEISLVEK